MVKNKVGFIGSGYMGFGMAKNLIKNFDDVVFHIFLIFHFGLVCPQHVET